MIFKNKFKLFICILFLNGSLNCKKIIIFSIPKCGTHLVAKSVELLTNKKLDGELDRIATMKNGLPDITDESKFYRCHLRYNKKIERQIKKENYKILFIYRDLRDQIVSRAYWIQTRNNLPLESIPSIIDDLINNFNGYVKGFLPWINSKVVCSVKFEDLIGQLGGGNEYAQRKAITKIAKFLNVQSTNLIDYTIKNLFGGTYTFREGKIGSWKTHFNLHQINQFKEKSNHLLKRLDYETDESW